MTTLAILLVLGYLIGSVPTAYLMGKALKGIDIREHGSGNPGATNVFRVVGKGAGSVTLLIDALKGYLPVFLVNHYLQAFLIRHYLPTAPNAALVTGLAAIAGHNWTVFLGFKGGKGVATSGGVFLALAPLPTLISIAGFLIGFLLSGHVSVGSILAAAVFPPALWVTHYSSTMLITGTVCAALVIVLHKKNIRRLLDREEPKAIRTNGPSTDKKS